MSQFTGESVMSIEQLSVDHNAGTNACAQGNHDEVLHTASHAIYHFTDGSGIGIVSQRYGDIVQALAEQFCQGHYAVVSPRKVRGKLDGAFIIVSVRGSDTH